MSLKNRLVIVGVGNVGSAVLNRAIAFELASEIVLIDVDEKKAIGEALDAEHSTPCTYSSNIRVRAGSYEDCKDARTIIISAGTGTINGELIVDRLLLAEYSIGIIKEVMGNIVKYTKEANIIVITNPLDVTTYLAAKFFDYPEYKLFGTGTTLETHRFKRIVANHYNVDAKDVQGYMLGEHGNSAFPAWSTLSIGGMRADRLDEYFSPTNPLDRQSVEKEVVKTAFDVLNFKGYTNYGIAMGACRLAKATLWNERSILPVSTILKGTYGLTDVALSLPAIITENGVERVLEIPLSDSEIEKLSFSANSIKKVLKANSLIK